MLPVCRNFITLYEHTILGNKAKNVEVSQCVCVFVLFWLGTIGGGWGVVMGEYQWRDFLVEYIPSPSNEH